MPHAAAVKVSRPKVKKPATARLCASEIVEAQAAQVMWLYYRDHKPEFVHNIRDYRGAIFASILQGDPVDQAFAPYLRVQPPARKS